MQESQEKVGEDLLDSIKPLLIEILTKFLERGMYVLRVHLVSMGGGNVSFLPSEKRDTMLYSSDNTSFLVVVQHKGVFYYLLVRVMFNVLVREGTLRVPHFVIREVRVMLGGSGGTDFGISYEPLTPIKIVEKGVEGEIYRLVEDEAETKGFFRDLLSILDMLHKEETLSVWVDGVQRFFSLVVRGLSGQQFTSPTWGVGVRLQKEHVSDGKFRVPSLHPPGGESQLILRYSADFRLVPEWKSLGWRVCGLGNLGQLELSVEFSYGGSENVDIKYEVYLYPHLSNAQQFVCSDSFSVQSLAGAVLYSTVQSVCERIVKEVKKVFTGKIEDKVARNYAFAPYHIRQEPHFAWVVSFALSFANSIIREVFMPSQLLTFADDVNFAFKEMRGHFKRVGDIRGYLWELTMDFTATPEGVFVKEKGGASPQPLLLTFSIGVGMNSKLNDKALLFVGYVVDIKLETKSDSSFRNKRVVLIDEDHPYYPLVDRIHKHVEKASRGDIEFDAFPPELITVGKEVFASLARELVIEDFAQRFPSHLMMLVRRS